MTNQTSSAQPVALVTGASDRVGATIAKTLARHGHAVVIHYRSNPEGASAVRDSIIENGGRAEILQALVRVHELRTVEQGCLRAIAGIHSVRDVGKLAQLWPLKERGSLSRGGISLALRLSEQSFLEKFHAGVTR